MSDENDDSKKDEPVLDLDVSSPVPEGTEEEAPASGGDELDEALGGLDDEASAKAAEGGEDVDVDALIADIDPNFKNELEGIDQKDFDGVSIESKVVGATSITGS